jgi:hypothetical protein
MWSIGASKIFNFSASTIGGIMVDLEPAKSTKPLFIFFLDKS